MAALEMRNLLTAFSPKGDYLSICTGDGRIKTWDTIGGILRGDYAEMTGSTPEQTDGHLSVDFTCMAWNPKKGKKKSDTSGSSFLLGLGTGSGDVLQLNTALGQLMWRVKNCHAGGVKYLVFAKSGSIIYTAGADGMICKLDVTSGQLLEKFRVSKRAISCIAVSGDGLYLAVGVSEIKIFDLSTKKRLCKFTGHADAVKTLMYTHDNQHLISSAVSERHVAIWKSDATKKGAAAACLLSMEHPAVSVHCDGSLSDLLQVLAITEAGVAYAWQAHNISELSMAVPVRVSVTKPKGKTSRASRSSGPTVFAGKIMSRSKSGQAYILLGYGTMVKPCFERVLLEGQGNDIMLQVAENGILLPAASPTSVIGNTGANNERVLGPDNAVDATMTRTVLELDETRSKPLYSKRKRRSVTDLMDNGTPLTDVERLKESEKDEIKETSASRLIEKEETMEEKLKALGIIEETEDVDDGNEITAPPTADSLSVLLTQALWCDDKDLLDQCLCVSDEKVIGNTVKSLNPVDASKFLQLAVSKVDSRTKRSLKLVPWIKAVLMSHASYIMSNPSLQPVLSSLYQVIDARLSVFRPLLSLSGRLDLLMAQVLANESRKQEVVTTAVVYEESDQDVEQDVEDVMDVDTVDEEDSDYNENVFGMGNGGLGKKGSEGQSEDSEDVD